MSFFLRQKHNDIVLLKGFGISKNVHLISPIIFILVEVVESLTKERAPAKIIIANLQRLNAMLFIFLVSTQIF